MSITYRMSSKISTPTLLFYFLLAILCVSSACDPGDPPPPCGAPDPTGVAFAHNEIQCHIDQTPYGGTYELPVGTYRIGVPIKVNRPMTFRTQGSGAAQYAEKGCYFHPTGALNNFTGSRASFGTRDTSVPCATLFADSSFSGYGGILFVGAPPPPSVPVTPVNPPASGVNEPTGGVLNVTVDHLIIDGRKSTRANSQALQIVMLNPHPWVTTAGSDVVFKNCDTCTFSNSTAINALGWTCLSWYESPKGTIKNSTFRDCGIRDLKPPVTINGMRLPVIANGMDLKSSADDVVIRQNNFIEGTDVGLGFDTHSAQRAKVQNNYFLNVAQGLFASFMIGGQPQRYKPGESGFTGEVLPPVTASPLADSNYTNLEVSGNLIDCRGMCDFGMLIGSQAHSTSLPRIAGTNIRFHDNRIENARRGIEVVGAGTATAPIYLTNNQSLTPYAATLPFGQPNYGEGGKLTALAPQFFPMTCWDQNFARCSQGFTACCTTRPTSAFDVDTARSVVSVSPNTTTYTTYGFSYP